jgi:anti-sigma factor RsiW
MIKALSSADREEALLLVNAYVDGELDAAAMLDLETRMESDQALKAEYDRVMALRRRILNGVPRDTASGALRNRVEELLVPVEANAVGGKRVAITFDWRQMAAAVVIAAGLASGATQLALRSSAPDLSIAAIVSGHQRALLAAEPYDVASSDRHTVKPWFDSKLALSPKIVDLTSSGYPLAGGRIDIVDDRKVPVLVYMRREHVISVIAIPEPSSEDNGAAVLRQTRDGYTLLSWRGQDFRYAAVSDVAEPELSDFVVRWRAGASSP